MAPSVRGYSWEDMEALCTRAAAAIHQSAFTADAIVAILRGGAFPGLLLSHLLGVREMYAFPVVTTVDDTVRAERLPPYVILDAPLPVSGKRVLLVDDVTNTGETLRAARAALRRSQPAAVLILSLVWDTAEVTDDLACEADLYIDKVDAWAHFPWEVP